MTERATISRRIVQIAGANTPDSVVCALCDDGSVWEGAWAEGHLALVQADGHPAAS
jgi:hypothetical protein